MVPKQWFRVAEAGLIDGIYLGFYDGTCYKDSLFRRIFPKRIRESSNENTPDQCKKFCKDGDYSYAGVENGDQCWCSNNLPPQSKIVDNSYCNKMPCTGDDSQTCGGAYRMIIYHTGIIFEN